MSNREYNGGKWTFARWKAFIISVLRSGWRKYPPRYDALKAALVGKRTNRLTGRMADHYKCASCSGFFVAKEVQVDHIEPVVDPDDGFVNFIVFIDRLFCEAENLQVLCKPCHKDKTNEERKQRKR